MSRDVICKSLWQVDEVCLTGMLFRVWDFFLTMSTGQSWMCVCEFLSSFKTQKELKKQQSDTWNCNIINKCMLERERERKKQTKRERTVVKFNLEINQYSLAHGASIYSSLHPTLSLFLFLIPSLTKRFSTQHDTSRTHCSPSHFLLPRCLAL